MKSLILQKRKRRCIRGALHHANAFQPQIPRSFPSVNLASLLPWEGPRAKGTTPSFKATPWAVQGSLSGTQPALSHPRPARTKSALCCTPSPRLFMAALCLLFENKQTNCLVHRAALSYSKGLFVQVLQEPGSVFQQQTEKIMP